MQQNAKIYNFCFTNTMFAQSIILSFICTAKRRYDRAVTNFECPSRKKNAVKFIITTFASMLLFLVGWLMLSKANSKNIVVVVDNDKFTASGCRFGRFCYRWAYICKIFTCFYVFKLNEDILFSSYMHRIIWTK